MTVTYVKAWSDDRSGSIVYYIDGKELMVSSEIPLALLADYARGAIIRGGATDWESYSAETDGAILIGDGTDIVSDTTPSIAGLVTLRTGAVLTGGTLDLNGNDLIIDTDSDSYLHASGDDVVDLVIPNATAEFGLTLNGAEDFTFTANSLNILSGSAITMADDTTIGLSGGGNLTFDSTPATDEIRVVSANLDLNDNAVIFDANGDTYLVSGLDDYVYVYISGALDFTFYANTFYVQSGSSIAMADDTWIGFTGVGGSIVFDSTPAPDQAVMTSLDLNMNGNDIIVPDNTADALTLYDTNSGGINYLRIISTDAQPIVRWNDGGVDVDYYIEAAGVADAFVVQGSDGQITLGALGAGFVQSTAGGVLSSSAILVGDLPAHAAEHEVGGGDLVDHDNLTNFVANEHIDHTSVSIGVAGTGLSGGGDISANRTITLTSTSDGAANHSTILASSAAGALTLDDLFVPDGGTVGITGNELITFNAAGTIVCSGISGLYVEDGDYVGVSGCAWLFDSSNSDISTTVNVGVGIAAPEGTLHVHTATAGAVAAAGAADEGVFENNGNAGITILSPDANYSSIYFGSPTDNDGAHIRWNHDSDIMIIGTANAGAEVSITSAGSQEAIRIDSNQCVFIGDTANTGMAVGLTINQGANDDELFGGKSSDVGQPFTDYAEADTYVTIMKHSAAAGGALLRGFRDSDDDAGWALVLQGYLGEAADTTKTVAGAGIVTITGLVTDGGTGVGNMTANGNVIAFRTERGGTRESIVIIDEDGDIYYDGALQNYDDYNDALAVKDAAQVLAGNWNDAIRYNAQALAAMGVISLNPDGTPAMVSHKRMTALMAGAIGQLYERVQQLEAMV